MRVESVFMVNWEWEASNMLFGNPNTIDIRLMSVEKYGFQEVLRQQSRPPLIVLTSAFKDRRAQQQGSPTHADW